MGQYRETGGGTEDEGNRWWAGQWHMIPLIRRLLLEENRVQSLTMPRYAADEPGFKLGNRVLP